MREGRGAEMDDWQEGMVDGAPVRVVARGGGVGVGAHPDGWCEFWVARRQVAPVIVEEQRGSCLGLALFLFAVANICGVALWVMRWVGG